MKKLKCKDNIKIYFENTKLLFRKSKNMKMKKLSFQIDCRAYLHFMKAENSGEKPSRAKSSPNKFPKS